MSSEISYTRVGDYEIPDIFLSERLPPDGYGEPLGRYARMRRTFLRDHNVTLYNTLLLSEKLYPHLREINATANERRECGVSEEIILAELIYD